MSSPKVLMKPPTLSDDDALDILLKTKLRLEAELEATAENYTLPTLPEDDRLNIAQAVLKKDVHLLQRTLQYFRDMDSTLEKQEQSLSATLERCSDIEAELTKCVETPSSEAEGTLVATRLKGINGVFQAMRAFFRKYLEKLEQERPELKISNALQELCTKMLDSPSDPYIDIVDLDINNETLMFMLMHNLVQRHSHYPSKIRMLDPRKQ
ncbi:hypothetical protein FHG87_003414 [Trinorchestia longiramus]|nr:hypothetical protein FHG87_003414 [Trinorchestia longiramus]